MTNMDHNKRYAHHPILLFDGVCNVCSEYVQFVLKRDRDGFFHFASLQSDVGKALLEKHGLSTDTLDTVVMIENNKAYTRSDVGIKMTPHLGSLWPLLYGLIIIPKPIRDWVYDLIAKNRYRWFGKKETCMIPAPEWKERFLDS